MSNSVLYEVEGRIARITLNRPEVLNALNRQMIEDLRQTVLRFNDDDEAWVAVVTGAGRAFCAGRDLKERAEDNASGRQPRAGESMYGDSLSMWPTTWKPMIAAVNGYALAGGWAVAQMCDLRIASEDARLGITEPRVGLMAPFAVQLNRLIPEAAVMELVLTAEPLPARRVLEMGFLNRVVPPERLMDDALELARTILKNAPLSLRSFKELVNRSREFSESEAALLTKEAYDRLLLSKDAREGPRAFAEKRDPVWNAE